MTATMTAPRRTSTPSLTFDIEEITPERAQEYLKKNKGNRHLAPATVDDYAQQMSSGRWLLTPEPIELAPNGAIINGQHRLHAVVKSGVPVRFTVARNVDPKVFAVIDQGRKRNAADLYVLMGGNRSYPLQITCAAGAMLRSVTGASVRSVDIARLARENEDAILSVLQATRADASGYSGAVNGAFARALTTFGEKVILPLAERYGRNEWQGARDPLAALREEVVRDKLRRQKKWSRPQLYGLAVTAIEAALDGRQVERLRPAGHDFEA